MGSPPPPWAVPAFWGEQLGGIILRDQGPACGSPYAGVQGAALGVFLPKRGGGASARASTSTFKTFSDRRFGVPGVLLRELPLEHPPRGLGAGAQLGSAGRGAAAQGAEGSLPSLHTKPCDPKAKCPGSKSAGSGGPGGPPEQELLLQHFQNVPVR